ncbi:hypothetical protein FCH28_37620 [Streptomyces piniterrae]|uniref:Uncharacterized protein n=2 Tax=Streptomyces piniterrae TaxID=2571125 RepID=A0A4U0MVQ2_9ACTN|nr:hypothetical protein FCH28_37620 [Streptomyces piniterrae]
MTLDQELAAAVAIARIGLERLRDVATRTADVAPHAAALQALRKGVLEAVGETIGTIAVSVTEVDGDDEQIERVTELLDEAQAYVEDSTGDRLDRVLEILTPMLLACEDCGQKKPEVRVMPDPFSTAVYPEEPDHYQMPLCPPCATARFEES